ncbi:hypothetical protein [Leucobacter sp. M11]|uniref:hypothetical protein n=1 Tax=Leucobacter sp. M11 TaxID=2993565 RepID=UPI002D7F3E38|nr:hypothetical protein [Leucobacter sp. M11]MEB4616201.1 hypothetical protein [Leucobacter sp. M11]
MTFRDILAGEARKALTLRSLTLATLISTVVMLAFTLVDALAAVLVNPARGSVSGLPGIDAGTYCFFYFSFLPIIIAVLVTSSEYAGGQLTVSMLAVPRRGAVLAAKLVTVVVATLGLAILQAVMILACYQGMLGENSVFATGGGWQHLGLLAQGVLYWLMLGVLSMSVAVIFRQQTGVLAVMVSLAFLSTPLLMISTAIFQYLPANVGTMMFMAREDVSNIASDPGALMGVPAATAVTVLWSVVAIIAAAIVFTRRDVGARLASAE